MNPILISGIQNILTALALIMLFFSLRKIRRLEKNLAVERGKHLLPQLNLEMVLEPDSEKGFYLSNDSFFLAKDIAFDAAVVSIDDFGFAKDFGLRFYCPSSLRPQERVKIDCRIIDGGQELQGKEKDTFFSHLFYAQFNLKARFRNVENIPFEQSIKREKEHFCIEKTERTALA